MVTLHSLINRDFGVRVRQRENGGVTAMTTTTAIVFRNDSSRLAFLIINLGAEDVFMRPNGVPSSTVGIRIAASGGSLAMEFDEDFNLPGLEWQGITGSGTSTLYTSETVIEPQGDREEITA